MKFRHYLLLVATMLFASCSAADETKAETPAHPTAINSQTMNITIDGVTHAVTLTGNAATNALVEKLRQGPVTVSLNTNGNFEIWGSLGFSLPTTDEYINGQPGDVVLYSGSKTEVQAETRRLVEKAGRKGVILGADCTVPRDIDWQRLDWVREAAV